MSVTHPVEELIADIRAGRMVILMDDEDRENEGDLVMAASLVRPEDINFMIRQARGLVCLTLTEQRCQQLNLPLMVRRSGAAHGTNFTLSIEAAQGVTTGISAADRARTVQAAVAPHARPADIVQPGHIFPLMAQPGGVLHRAGHTEAGCDLARLAGLEPAAVIVEIIREDGEMARRPDLEVFALEHGLKMGTIADLIQYRILHEQTIERLDSRTIQTRYGPFTLHRYREIFSPEIHLALVRGDPAEGVTTVRVQGLNPRRDLLDVQGPGGRKHWNLDSALRDIASQPRGVLVWIEQPGSLSLGEQLGEPLAHYSEPAAPVAQVSYRSVGIGAQILRDVGVRQMRLLSSPLRFNGLSGFDLEITEFVEAGS